MTDNLKQANYNVISRTLHVALALWKTTATGVQLYSFPFKKTKIRIRSQKNILRLKSKQEQEKGDPSLTHSFQKWLTSWKLLRVISWWKAEDESGLCSATVLWFRQTGRNYSCSGRFDRDPRMHRHNFNFTCPTRQQDAHTHACMQARTHKWPVHHPLTSPDADQSLWLQSAPPAQPRTQHRPPDTGTCEQLWFYIQIPAENRLKTFCWHIIEW